MSLKSTLISTGLLIGVPILPDMGIQFLLATFFGLLLPRRLIEPINVLVLVVAPPAVVFERALRGIPRVRHLIPRIIAGYAITVVLGAVLVITGYLLPA